MATAPVVQPSANTQRALKFRSVRTARTDPRSVAILFSGSPDAEERLRSIAAEYGGRWVSTLHERKRHTVILKFPSQKRRKLFERTAAKAVAEA